MLAWPSRDGDQTHEERGGTRPVPAVTTRGLPRLLARTFVLLWLALAVGNAVALWARFGLGRDYLWGVVPFLDTNVEQSWGTWVSSLLHLTCGLAAAGCALVARHQGERWQRNWWLLAAVFALLSMEEVASFHNAVMIPLREALGASGILYYAWILPAAVLGVAFLLLQLRFLRSLGRIGRDLVLAGAVFVAGAIGLEMIEGVLATDAAQQTLPYALTTTAEEMLEFAGVMWAACVLVSYLLDRLGSPVVEVLATRPATPPAGRG